MAQSAKGRMSNVKAQMSKKTERIITKARKYENTKRAKGKGKMSKFKAQISNECQMTNDKKEKRGDRRHRAEGAPEADKHGGNVKCQNPNVKSNPKSKIQKKREKKTRRKAFHYSVFHALGSSLLRFQIFVFS